MFVFVPSAAVAPAAPPAAVPLTAADSHRNHNHTASPSLPAYTTPSIQVHPAAQAQSADMSAGLAETSTPSSAPPLPVFPPMTLVPAPAPTPPHVPGGAIGAFHHHHAPLHHQFHHMHHMHHHHHALHYPPTHPPSAAGGPVPFMLVPVGPGGSPLVAASGLPAPPQPAPQPAALPAAQHVDPSAGAIIGHHLFHHAHHVPHQPPSLHQQVAPVPGGAEGQKHHVQSRTVPSAPVPTPPAPLVPEVTVQAPPEEKESRMTLPGASASYRLLEKPLPEVVRGTAAVAPTKKTTQPPIDTSRLMVTTSWGGGAGAGDRSPGSSGLGLSASDAPSSIPPSSLSLSTFSPNHASMSSVLSVGSARSPTVLTLTSAQPGFDRQAQPVQPTHPGPGSLPIPAQAGVLRDGPDDVAPRAASTVPPPSSSPAPQKCPLIAVGGVLQRPLAVPAQDVTSSVVEERRKRRFNQNATIDPNRPLVPVMDTLTDVLGKAIEDVDPRAVLRRSRTLRKKIRVAWYHLMRPPQDLTPTERVKASRLPEFEAALARLDETARQLGLLPATEEAVLQEGARLMVLLSQQTQASRLAEEVNAASHSVGAADDCDNDDSSDTEWDFGTLYRKFVQSAAHHLEKVRRMKQRIALN